jgi:uncharacterized membrane protein YphA (DoxX/SURF4 family)
MKIVLWISRILFGIVFIFSGFVKAIDPLGSAYKFQDYFLAFDAAWMFSLALPLAILLSTFELVAGVGVLLGLKMRLSATLGLLFMVFFTPLTFYIALENPVPDCGCFGDALLISNWETFYKNIFILAAAIFIFIHRNKVRPLLSPRKDWYLLGVTTLLSIGLSVYCLMYEPIIDFRPWHKGANINDKVIPTEEISDIYLIFRNIQTGELQEWPVSNYPWNDPQWTEQWEYHGQRREIIQPYREAEISNFVIMDEFGFDYTESYISNPDYQLIVVAPNLHTTNSRAFTRRINPLAEQAYQAGYSLIVLTGSSFESIEQFRHQHQSPYPFYQSGEVELKTIMRSSPGLLLLKDGVVLNKWPYRRIGDLQAIGLE